jgi:hypothetical protein
MLPNQLLAAWRQEAAVFRRNGDESAARMKERDAQDLEEAFETLGDVELDRETAAELLDMTPDSLSRATSSGKVKSTGQKWRPRYRLRDLLKVDAIPGLPSFAERPDIGTPTRTQIARSIAAAGGDDGR